MKIVVNHVTRMRPGRICVAGIDVDTQKHVRPVLGAQQLSTKLLRAAGGAFDIAAVVDLGTTRPHPSPPETEDHVFKAGEAKWTEDLAARKFWKLLKSMSRRNLADIFGPALKPRSSGCTIDAHTGVASLGCLIPAAPPSIYVDEGWEKPKIRAKFTDGTFSVDLSVTDARLHWREAWEPREDVVTDVRKRIKKGVDVILSVGLARAFAAKGDTEPRHWLQVNNFHLADDPIWRVG